MSNVNTQVVIKNHSLPFEQVISQTYVGVNPNNFGASTWTYLHWFSLNYPNQPTAQYKNDTSIYLFQFFQRIACASCRIHTMSYIKEHPINLETRTGFVLWVFDFHNAVNARRKVKQMTQQEFVNQYILNIKQKDTKKQEISHYWKYLCILFIAIIILLFIWIVFLYVKRRPIKRVRFEGIEQEGVYL